ncbi:MAG: hypothetical protein KC636_05450 [Myxococcales bacterium]|nr:hypothetical protein [Myxococcales bacterium]
MEENVHGAWNESLRHVMREVLRSLPDDATLGDIVDAARSNAQMAPVLDIFMVQDLIESALSRPAVEPTSGKNGNGDGHGITFDDDGNPLIDLAVQAAVIRRRADVPDGDTRVLKALTKQKSGRRELELAQVTGLTAEQLRLLLRGLRTKGYIHIEGSGTKRKIKITRHGSSHLRKQGRH